MTVPSLSLIGDALMLSSLCEGRSSSHLGSAVSFSCPALPRALSVNSVTSSGPLLPSLHLINGLLLHGSSAPSWSFLQQRQTTLRAIDSI